MSVQKTYTIDEYIANPLTQEQVATYESRMDERFRYEKKCWIMALLPSIIIGILSLQLLPDLPELPDGVGMSHLYPMTALAIGFLAFISISTYIAAEMGPKKFPYSLVIDEQDFMLDLGYYPFDATTVREENILPPSKAKALLDAIKRLDRPVMKFEKEIMKRLMEI